MNKVIVFGLQDFAELAHYYLTHDSDYEVVAFCVHEAFLPQEKTRFASLWFSDNCAEGFQSFQ